MDRTRLQQRPRNLVPPLLLLLIGLWASAPAGLDAANRLAPGQDWQTVETEHFSVHVPREFEALAQRAGRAAEAIYGRLTRDLDWRPWGKTQIVLTDDGDFSNGFATPVPNNLVQVWLRPPAPGEGLEDYGDWLTLVLAHEFTHTLHLDMVGGTPRVLRRIFGRVPALFFFPNAFAPAWWVEGLATYEETRLTGGGRTGGSTFEMMLRSAALEDVLFGPDRAYGARIHWPGRSSPYLYGAAFIEDLARRQGHDVLRDLAHDYARRLLPFRVSAVFEAQAGAPLPDLWEDWRARVEDHARAVAAAQPQAPTADPTPLTQRGFRIGWARFQPGEQTIAFTEIGVDDRPQLRLIDLGTGRDERLTDRFGEGAVSFTPDGRAIVFSQLEFYHTFRVFSDLYLYDLESGTLRRLTRGQRLRSPDVHPSGRWLVAVQEGGGGTRLVRVDLDSGDLEVLVEATGEGEVYGAPRFDPQGKLIALACRRRGTSRIELYKRDGTFIETLTPPDQSATSPAFVPGKKAVIYASNPGGISNLYERDLQTGATRQLTVELGGAFEPAVDDSGRTLVYTRYSARGYDLVVRPYPAGGREPAPLQVARVGLGPALLAREEEGEDSKRSYPVHPYRSFRTLLPRWWLPLVDRDEAGTLVGLTSGGEDALGRHQWALRGLYGLDSRRFSYAATYINDVFYPTVTLELVDLVENLGDLWSPPEGEPGFVAAEAPYWQRRRSLTLDVALPVQRMRRGWSLHLGAGREDLIAASTPRPGLERPATGRRIGAFATLAYDDTRRFPRSISPEKGLMAALRFRRDRRAWGGDIDRDDVALDTRIFLPVPLLRRAVAGVWLKAARSTGTPLLQQTYALGGSTGQEGLLGVLGGGFPLRGYPEAVQRGDRIGLASLELRLPIAYPERGGDTVAFFLDRIHGAAFVDAGLAYSAATTSDIPWRDAKVSVGLEATVEFNLGYAWPLALRVGLAYRLDDARPADERLVSFASFGHAF